jgi:hypothetical protein
MGTYIPHPEGTVQSIVRLTLARYQGYANPPQVFKGGMSAIYVFD